MTAYYNEHDPYAAQWLRNLIDAGHIAPGIVDERSIEDVFPSDLRGFTQCHFFAGIGVWSHALRRSGWADSRPVWTGSCPCQPFSSAGQGAAFDDERHLWPAFHHLIKECRPANVLGEQVASKDADPWIDLVSSDVEALGYTFGAIPFPSAGVGAPHIRDRLYWVANAQGSRGRSHLRGVDGGASAGLRTAQRQDLGRSCEHQRVVGSVGATGGLADADGGHAGAKREQRGREQRQQPEDGGAVCGLGNPDGQPAGRDTGAAHAAQVRHGAECRNDHGSRDASFGVASRPGPTNGLWRDADWLLCRDGKWRPVEPGSFPLAHGTSKGLGRSRADWHTPAGEEGQGHRAGRLKGYGNAINAEAARVFVECVMEVCP